MMKLNRVVAIVLILLAVFSTGVFAQEAKGNALVLQTDFGLKDGAVSAMKGVAIGVDPDLRIFDLTHEIPAYNIWEASYRLMQTASYWPAGTVFVSVVDPGVGTDRTSVVVKTKTGHYFVTPDNGTLTLIEESMGISEIRQIDENINRLQGSSDSYTFHGRDVYAYTGARLAAKAITFEQIGPVVNREIVKIGYQKAVMQGDVVLGNIPILDIQYGNVWTNIDKKLIDALNIKKNDLLKVEIYNKGNRVYQGTIPYVNSFGDVPDGKPLAYANSLMQLSFALNMDSFSAVHKVYSGPEWTVKVQKVNK